MLIHLVDIDNDNAWIDDLPGYVSDFVPSVGDIVQLHLKDENGIRQESYWKVLGRKVEPQFTERVVEVYIRLVSGQWATVKAMFNEN